MTMPTPKPVLAAACGNPLAGDDAFGMLVLRRLACAAPGGLELLDLSLNPTTLLDHVAGRRALLIVDAAISASHAPGEILDLDFFSAGRPQLRSDRVVSTHGLSISHQLELAGVLGIDLPRCVRLIVLVILPPELGQASGCSASQIGRAADLVVQWARRWEAEFSAGAGRSQREPGG